MQHASVGVERSPPSSKTCAAAAWGLICCSVGVAALCIERFSVWTHTCFAGGLAGQPNLGMLRDWCTKSDQALDGGFEVAALGRVLLWIAAACSGSCTFWRSTEAGGSSCCVLMVHKNHEGICPVCRQDAAGQGDCGRGGRSLLQRSWDGIHGGAPPRSCCFFPEATMAHQQLPCRAVPASSMLAGLLGDPRYSSPAVAQA